MKRQTRICTQIALDPHTSNKDKIEARRSVDMANAHIYKLVSEGPIFHQLPELKVKVKELTDTNTTNIHTTPTPTQPGVGTQDPHTLPYHIDTNDT